MVRKKTPLRVNVRQDRNSASRTYGMWFPYVDQQGTLSTRALCAHIADHGSIWTEDIVSGILGQLKECIPELVSQGYGVKLDGLGIFWPTVQNKKGGAESGVDYNPNDQIEGVHIRFQADSTALDDLSAKAFKEYCCLGLQGVLLLGAGLRREAVHRDRRRQEEAPPREAPDGRVAGRRRLPQHRADG